MQKNQLRTVLIVAIFMLLGLITAILVKRSSSTSLTAARVIETPNKGVSSDNAMLRIQRAGAVTAIERGDYKSAITALSSIVKSGGGVGDEVELLRMAKELDEKYRQPAGDSVNTPAACGSAANAPDGPVVVPAVNKPVAVAQKPAPSPARKPALAPAPPPKPVVVARANPEPPTGLLLVTSVPTGLSVEVDGRRSEFTPLRKVMDVGPHTVVIYRRDEPVFRKTVNVPKDGVATVDADLTPEKVERPEPAPAPVEPKPAVADPKPPVAAPVTNPAAPPPVVKPAPNGDTGEVLVMQAGLVGDVFIEGVSYGPPPVLAKAVPVGEVSVELRADGSVKRKKIVVVEKNRRANVQFR